MKFPPVGAWVIVEWADAIGAGQDWEPLKNAGNARLGRGIALGRLSAITKDWMVIVPHVMEIDGRVDGCGDLTIPRQCVTRVATLNVPKWAKVEP